MHSSVSLCFRKIFLHEFEESSSNIAVAASWFRAVSVNLGSAACGKKAGVPEQKKGCQKVISFVGLTEVFLVTPCKCFLKRPKRSKFHAGTQQSLHPTPTLKHAKKVCLVFATKLNSNTRHSHCDIAEKFVTF